MEARFSISESLSELGFIALHEAHLLKTCLDLSLCVSKKTASPLLLRSIASIVSGTSGSSPSVEKAGHPLFCNMKFNPLKTQTENLND